MEIHHDVILDNKTQPSAIPCDTWRGDFLQSKWIPQWQPLPQSHVTWKRKQASLVQFAFYTISLLFRWY